MHALILTIDNFRYNHGIATKSGDISPNLLEIFFLSRILHVAMATQYSTPYSSKFSSFSIFLQILTTHFKQTVIFSLEIIYGTIFWMISNFARDF